jgi:hypothetical protein
MPSTLHSRSLDRRQVSSGETVIYTNRCLDLKSYPRRNREKQKLRRISWQDLNRIPEIPLEEIDVADLPCHVDWVKSWRTLKIHHQDAKKELWQMHFEDKDMADWSGNLEVPRGLLLEIYQMSIPTM